MGCEPQDCILARTGQGNVRGITVSGVNIGSKCNGVLVWRKFSRSGVAEGKLSREKFLEKCLGGMLTLTYRLTASDRMYY